MASWVYAKYGADRGIWKASPGTEPAKIIDGMFSDPVVSPDGKWMVAMKLSSGEGKYNRRLIRYNLQTGKEFPVNLPQNGFGAPLAYIPAHAKVLLGSEGNDGERGLGGRNYLLDPETGTVQLAQGEFRPLARGQSRMPQWTGTPNEFWAAIYDSRKRVTRFGRYDTKAFSFAPLLELPELQLASDNIWVDVAAGKVWLNYRGQLLRLPLPARSK
jgi:hypothetical protein